MNPGIYSTILLILTITAIQCEASCPEGWIPNNSYCYKKSVDALEWSKAESFCQMQGGHLVNFIDSAERDWVFNNFISGTGKDWWIGLNDIVTEETFEWSDPNVITYPSIFNWMLGEPNNDDDEDCVKIIDVVEAVTGGNWVDVMCRQERNYICKIPDAPVEDCDTDLGFIKAGSYCYYYAEAEKTWHDVRLLFILKQGLLFT